MLLVGRLEIPAQRADDRLVVREKIREHLAGVGVSRRLLLEACQLDKLRQRADRVSSERPRGLGDLVHHIAKRASYGSWKNL